MIIASIDIGTNTIILLIAEVNIKKQQISPLYNEQRIPRIGKGLLPGKSIKKEKIKELLIILEQYQKIINDFKCEKVLITATNALRIASNTNEIKKMIHNKLNLHIDVVSGENEADLTFKGAVFQYNDNSKSLVIDIGGGSTEIIYGDKKNILFKKSYQFGVVNSKEKFFKHSPPLQGELIEFHNELTTTFKDLKEKDFLFERAIAIAGTPTTLAAIKLNLPEYNEDLLEDSNLNRNEIKDLFFTLTKLSSTEILKKYKSMVRGREDVILSGACILLYLLYLFDITEVLVSTRGIRYGAICNKLFG